LWCTVSAHCLLLAVWMTDTAFVSLPPNKPAGSEPRQVVTVEEIDVGGSIFKTTPLTLRKSPFLAALLDQSVNFATRDSNDRLFIDRDPILFGHILKFLRSGQWPSFDKADTQLVLELRTECGYFGVEGPTPPRSVADESLDVIAMVRLDEEGVYSGGRTDELVPRVTLIGKHTILQEVLSLAKSNKYITGVPALLGKGKNRDMVVAHFENADERLWTSLESALLNMGWRTKSEEFNITLLTEIRTHKSGYDNIFPELDVKGQGRRFVFTRERNYMRS